MDLFDELENFDEGKEEEKKAKEAESLLEPGSRKAITVKVFVLLSSVPPCRWN